LVFIPKTIGIAGLIAKAREAHGTSAGKLIEKAGKAAEIEYTADKRQGIFVFAHCVRVAEKLLEMGFDAETVAAGLLHDAGEHGTVSYDEISKGIGKDIALIVQECIKIRQIEEKNIDTTSPKTLSTILIATAKDIRAMIVNFVARVDMLERAAGNPNKKTIELAKGGLEIYAPICQKLGLYELQSVLEDNSLRITKPEMFKKISEIAGKDWEERKKEAEEAVKEFSGFLKEKGKNVSVQGRAKGIYSIYKKIEKQGRKPEEIFDILGVRAICDSVKECYEILGIVHSKYRNASGKFSDYISNPKKNGYRSIHTVVMWRGKPLEVQIRTWEMHYECETGLAAHWQYKDYAEDKFFDKRLSLAKQLVEWHRQAKTGQGLAHSLKMDFGRNKIFVFTPKNKVVVLPEESTTIDFAFAIHTDLGNKFKQAKVNGRIAPLAQKLENGDVIEVITAKTRQVKRQWLNLVKSSKARTKIKQNLGIKPGTRKKSIKEKQETLTSDKNTRLAKCCNPVPGDEIVGVRTTKRKISIHRAECENAREAEESKLIKIRWSLAARDYVVGLNIRAKDSPLLLPSILKVVSEEKVAVVSTDTKTTQNNVLQCRFNLKIRNTEQLGQIIDSIAQIPTVFDIKRE